MWIVSGEAGSAGGERGVGVGAKNLEDKGRRDGP